MKTHLIQTHLNSRSKIDLVAKKLGLDQKGSRENVINRISNCSYSAIKNAINEKS